VGNQSMPEERPSLQPPTPPEITLPAPRLDVPAAPERQFAIRHTDWLQLRRKVAAVSSPIANLASIGWACVGIAASAAIAYLTWIAAYSQLTPKVQEHYAFISPTLVVTAIASAIIALFSFYVSKREKQKNSELVESILEDMDSIHAPYEICNTQKPTAPHCAAVSTSSAVRQRCKKAKRVPASRVKPATLRPAKSTQALTAPRPPPEGYS